MAFARAFIGIALLYFCAPAGASSEKRVALVIGVSHYDAVQALPNPARDAAAVAASLKRLGFEVTPLADPTKASFEAALKTFGDAARGAEWALVYFAGHGIGADGETYLIPRDAELAHADHIEDETVSLSRVRDKLKRAQPAPCHPR